MNLMRNTRWGDEDPLRRLVRLAAFPAGALLLLLGCLSGDPVTLSGGVTLFRFVAMAAPERQPPAV